MARNRFLIIGLIVALVLGCGLISAGSLIYRIGFSNGFGQGAVVASASGGDGAVVPPRASAPYGYGYNTWGYQPHAGLSIMPILGLCMIGLFFWLVIGGIFRARRIFGARMWRHGHGMWGRGPWEYRHGCHDKGPWGSWDDQPGQGHPPQEKPSNEATL